MSRPRERAQSLKLDLPADGALIRPPIAAIFLIRFDLRAGYVIAWKESIAGVELDGVVEYKSLPSGLHNVKEDLVYFVHDDYAGLSAFINEPAAESERNALMLAVGVLVPLSYGRLGKSWRHAESLKNLIRILVRDPTNTSALSDYWNKYRVPEDAAAAQLPDSPLDSPAIIKFNPNHDPQGPTKPKARNFSDATAFFSSKHSLTSYHPALSIPEFTSDFGPLIFPLYRLALLRRRILISSDAPVQLACNFVYALSIISSIPKSMLALLPADMTPSLRLRPLFSVGIHDIPSLMSNTAHNPDPSWVACTTDTVLSTKAGLYDILVELHPENARNSSKHYPRISTPLASMSSKATANPTIRATQRDARRYHTLRQDLRKLPRSSAIHSPTASPPLQAEASERQEDEDNENDDDVSSTFSSSDVVEPISWPVLAYTSFIWWASAGERRVGQLEDEDEVEQDTDLLLTENETHTIQMHTSAGGDRNSHQPQELALVAYFHRLTFIIFTTLTDAINRHDSKENTRLGDDDSDETGGYLSRRSTLESEMDYDENDGLETEEDTPLLQEANTSIRQPHIGKSHIGKSNLVDDLDVIQITTDDMTVMGLDVWSQSDRGFVEELLGMWWGRKGRVLGPRVECCGVRVY